MRFHSMLQWGTYPLSWPLAPCHITESVEYLRIMKLTSIKCLHSSETFPHCSKLAIWVKYPSFKGPTPIWVSSQQALSFHDWQSGYECDSGDGKSWKKTLRFNLRNSEGTFLNFILRIFNFSVIKCILNFGISEIIKFHNITKLYKIKCCWSAYGISWKVAYGQPKISRILQIPIIPIFLIRFPILQTFRFFQ